MRKRRRSRTQKLDYKCDDTQYTIKSLNRFKFETYFTKPNAKLDNKRRCRKIKKNATITTSLRQQQQQQSHYGKQKTGKM